MKLLVNNALFQQSTSQSNIVSTLAVLMWKLYWTGRACTGGCDFILFYLHRLLLLFTFIVFVSVHVLLTLYLEYDL